MNLSRVLFEHQTSSSTTINIIPTGFVEKTHIRMGGERRKIEEEAAHIKLLGILHVHWIFVLFISFVSIWHCAWHPCAISEGTKQQPRRPRTHIARRTTQAAYSELNYHHRNDYRDYQIKFSSLWLTNWRRHDKKEMHRGKGRTLNDCGKELSLSALWWTDCVCWKRYNELGGEQKSEKKKQQRQGNKL